MVWFSSIPHIWDFHALSWCLDFLAKVWTFFLRIWHPDKIFFITKFWVFLSLSTTLFVIKPKGNFLHFQIWVGLSLSPLWVGICVSRNKSWFGEKGGGAFVLKVLRFSESKPIWQEENPVDFSVIQLWGFELVFL